MDQKRRYESTHVKDEIQYFLAKPGLHNSNDPARLNPSA
jgi:hypothetical protein